MTPRKNQQIVRTGKWSDANIVPLLSLKLLLLAFFILLNARSSLEDIKVNAVLQSVNIAFNGQVLVPRNINSQSAGAGPLDGTALALDEIGSIFEAMLPAVDRQDSPRGPIMVLELSAQSFFVAGQGRLQSGRDLLLRRLVEVLIQDHGFERAEVRFLHASEPGDSPITPVVAARLEAMSEKLLRLGLQSDNLYVGLFEESRDRVRFEILLEPLAGSQDAGLAQEDASVGLQP